MQSRTRLAKQLIRHIKQVQSHLRSGQPSAWSGLNVTMPQAKTLFLLADGPRRMSGIAKRLNVEMPSATTMIDRLVAKGLVERRQDPEDRRAVVCSITKAGMDAVERFWSIRAARMESFVDTLRDDELETVVPAMKILSDATRRPSLENGNGRTAKSDRAKQIEGARA